MGTAMKTLTDIDSRRDKGFLCANICFRSTAYSSWKPLCEGLISILIFSLTYSLDAVLRCSSISAEFVVQAKIIIIKWQSSPNEDETFQTLISLNCAREEVTERREKKVSLV